MKHQLNFYKFTKCQQFVNCNSIKIQTPINKNETISEKKSNKWVEILNSFFSHLLIKFSSSGVLCNPFNGIILQLKKKLQPPPPHNNNNNNNNNSTAVLNERTEGTQPLHLSVAKRLRRQPESVERCSFSPANPPAPLPLPPPLPPPLPLVFPHHR